MNHNQPMVIVFIELALFPFALLGVVLAMSRLEERLADFVERQPLEPTQTPVGSSGATVPGLGDEGRAAPAV